MPDQRIPTWVILLSMLALAAVVWVTDAILSVLIPGR